jgi:FkbM family methyltransferase
MERDTMDRSRRLKDLYRQAQRREQHSLAAALVEGQRITEAPAAGAPQLLEQAYSLRAEGRTTEAAWVAWRCRSDYPATSADAVVLLRELDEAIPGLLFDDHLVWVTTRAVVSGGSWLDLSTELRPLPAAWDSEVLRHFSGLLRNRRARVLLDVGANTGSFALLGSVHPGLECHAVEPSPVTAAMLRRHLALNALDAVTTVHECALSNTTGTGVLKSPQQTGLATLGSGNHLQEHVDTEVDTFRLDDLAQARGFDRLDAIKIDTEGHELRVLQGAERTIERWRPVILLEAVDVMMDRHGYARGDLQAFLERYDYVLSEVGTEDIVARPATRGGHGTSNGPVTG